MSHPPYHLRHNKAVDRFLFMELLLKLNDSFNYKLTEYTYHGFGGPFLDDFKLLHQYFPEIPMVSVEQDPKTHLRQKFNRPHKNIRFFKGSFDDYLSTYNNIGKDIIWLDYTSCKFSDFTLLQGVIDKVERYSIIKVTLNANHVSHIGQENDQEREKKIENFKEVFDEFLPVNINDSRDFRPRNYPYLLLKMLKVSIESVLCKMGSMVFQPLTSFVYQDGQRMLTLTGILLEEAEVNELMRKLGKWKYLNIDWKNLIKIDVPTLSVKERLTLDTHLPIKGGSVVGLSKKLGYKLEKSENKNIDCFKQYADFYRFYPYFTRVSV